MKKSNTDTCCLTLPLKLGKWQEDRLAKRFEIARQLYNTLVHAELKRLAQVKQTAEYRENERKIRTLDWNDPGDQAKLKGLYKERRKSLKTAGFTDYSFTTDMGKYYKHFRDNIGSNVALHGIAPQVWAAFDKLLFKKGGKKVHYKKPGEVNSVQGYSRTGKSGGTEIMFREPYIEWKGLKLPLKLSPDNAYETDMLQRRVKLVRLVRRPGKRRDRWYAQLVLEGEACDQGRSRYRKSGSPYRQRPRRAGHRAANTGVFRRRGGRTRRTGRSGTEHRAGKAPPAAKNGPEQKGNQPG